ncbi:hypothetical protein [Kordiimonas laminariae]|uniref:hypothetical protein n=1 Tax=Kordiimonas laminariae TaxID=2917717 RepID=UPI001FF69EF7|nr:hypothetical protein [Kordiimonas laminariae]MCK0067988.1 hypothetical protein [Kordiimonas laminariae]
MMSDFSILETIGIVGFVETLPAKAAFVADAEIIDYLKNEIQMHEVDFQSIDALEINKLSQRQSIYVLSRRGELGLARQLRRKLGDKQVSSVTYQVLPRLTLSSKGLGVRDDESPPRLMVVAQGSGFEIFADLLRDAGLADYQEHMSPDVHAWIKTYADFSFLRFLKNVVEARADQRLDTILGMDVLFSMLEQRQIRIRYSKNLYKKLEGSVLYFANRDKCREAVVNACLETTPYRTQGEVPKDARAKVFGVKPDVEDAFSQLNQILEAAFKLETHLEFFPQFKFVTVWDMQQNHDMVVENIALFLGEHVRRKAKVGSDEWLDQIPAFAAALQGLKDRMAQLIKLKSSS